MKYRLKTLRQVCRSPRNLVWKCGMILSNIVNGQNPVMCSRCCAHQEKKGHWGYIAPYIHYSRGARFHFYENCVHFLWFFLRIVENSGFPRWNIQISSKLISWNSLNIKSHHQLVNLHEFLEIGSIEKKFLGEKLSFWSSKQGSLDDLCTFWFHNDFYCPVWIEWKHHYCGIYKISLNIKPHSRPYYHKN